MNAQRLNILTTLLHCAVITLLLTNPASGDAIVCTSGPSPANGDCATEVAKPKATLIGADLVLWCYSNYPPDGGARDTCDGKLWLRYADTQSDNFILSDAGWHRLNQFPPDGQAPAPLPPPPIAVPKCPIPKYWDDAYKVIDVAADIGIGWWFCDKDARIVDNWVCVSPQKLPRMRGRLTTYDVAALVINKRKCTPGELAAQRAAWDDGYTLKAWTAGSGTAKDIPGFYKNADGTRSGEVTRVKIGLPCNYQMRIIKFVDGKTVGTQYFAVVAGSINGRDVYANCKFDGVIVK